MPRGKKRIVDGAMGMGPAIECHPCNDNAREDERYSMVVLFHGYSLARLLGIIIPYCFRYSSLQQMNILCYNFRVPCPSPYSGASVEFAGVAISGAIGNDARRVSIQRGTYEQTYRV